MDPSKFDAWDRIFLSKVNQCIQLCDAGYKNLHYRDVIKYGFYEMMSIKESYLIGKDQKPNPFLLLMYMQNMLIVLNPITPTFCQNTWTVFVRPAMLKCSNLPAEAKADLCEMGFPTGVVDPVYISQFNYLTAVKSEIRVVHAKAMGGDKKKGGKKGKAPAVEEAPKAALETCCMFVGLEFPTYKKQVLEILQTLEFEFDDKGKPSAGMKKLLAPAVKAVITDKKASGLAMSFANFQLEIAAKVGKEEALQIALPFNEQECL